MDNGPKIPAGSLRVGVVDGLNRERLTWVYTRDNRVVVLPPPGEGFTLTGRDARKLAAFLREAANGVNDPVEGPDAVTTAATTSGNTTAKNSRRPGDTPRHPGDASRLSVSTDGEPPR